MATHHTCALSLSPYIMATNCKEENDYLRFYRDKGYGWSTTWTGYGIELPDDGAEIWFQDSSWEEYSLNIHFGYNSPSGKEYKRDLNLDIHQVIQLRDLLNNCINKQAMEGRYFYIFSYGSNMLLQRLIERIESVEVIGVHELKGFTLVFNKKSTKDGSTKANIQETKDRNDSVWGVIHKVPLIDKPILDKCEGLGNGYLLINFNLSIEDESRSIHSYVATEYRYLEEGKPYDWYLNFVIEGAIENDLPEDYIDKLKAIDSEIDMNVERRKKNEAILKRAKDNNR